jgi:hypothetical protein
VIPKTLKAKTGRIEQAAHLDLIEFKWVDASSQAAWMSPNEYSALAVCISCGYFDEIIVDKITGEKVLSVFGDTTERPKLNARHHSVPLKNVIEVRVVSKGEPVGSKEKKKVRHT